jgi:cytochrome b6-f complex iron-sulfur subunit
MMNKEEAISRTKFLKTLGLNGAALFAATYCTGMLTSCTNEAGNNVTPVVNGTTIDLSTAQYTKLNTMGNYVIVNNIVVAHTNEGKFVAVPLTCSHEGRKEVTYKVSEFYCTAHGARFDNSGKGLNKDGSGGLKLFTVTQVGTVLTIS